MAIQPGIAMHPGRVLAEIYMRDHHISQTDLAKKIGCAHRKINEIVNGKRSITPEFALELEKVFKAPADIWVRIQAEYDLWVVREKRKHAA
jgi:antitoxin HigA-1